MAAMQARENKKQVATVGVYESGSTHTTKHISGRKRGKTRNRSRPWEYMNLVAHTAKHKSGRKRGKTRNRSRPWEYMNLVAHTAKHIMVVSAGKHETVRKRGKT